MNKTGYVDIIEVLIIIEQKVPVWIVEKLIILESEKNCLNVKKIIDCLRKALRVKEMTHQTSVKHTSNYGKYESYKTESTNFFKKNCFVIIL